MELWKNIPGIDDKYMVSSGGKFGRWRTKNGKRFAFKFIDGHQRASGHIYVNIHKKDYPVHALALTAFVGERPAGLVTRHLNGNPANNSLSNLVWGTQKENIHDKYLHGTMPLGEKHFSSTVSDSMVRKIKKLIAQHKYSYRELSEKYGVSKGLIGSWANGQSRGRPVPNRKKWWGESLPQAKLTEESVWEIRKMLKSGIANKDIAEMFAVSRCTISDIKYGRTWSNLS